MSHRSNHTHCQSPTSQCFNQRFANECACPTQEEKLKISSPLENKKYPNPQADTRHISNLTMTRKINNDNGLQGQKTERQLVTKAICNKGFSGNSTILPRLKFGVGGQESSPQSLTAHSVPLATRLIALMIHITNSIEFIFPLRFCLKGQLMFWAVFQTNSPSLKQHICKPDEKIGLQKSCFFLPALPSMFGISKKKYYF